MVTRIFAMLLASLLALPLAAQSTEETTEETSEGTGEALEVQTTPATELSTGEPAPEGTDSEGPALGQPYTRETAGDWELRCVRTQNPDEDPCQLYQLLKDDSGNAVSEVSVFRLPAGGDVVAGATVIVPLETLLTGQLTIAVDGANPKRYPFSFCTQAGCYARLGLTQADVDAFKRGAAAQVTIRPVAAPDRTVTVNMSLSGFTAGFDLVNVVQNQ